MKYKNFAYPYLILFFAFSAFYTDSARCEERSANSLINESSPYLLKHAKNPVDWYPWGDEAFSLAKEKDKPILLSIGYLTCHWCNVMEEESFSDPQVAALINDVFIPIKVDREERPDIDQIYMKACHLLSPACGWPLTLFLTPKGKPFYAGTYIPKENRFGRLGLLELIPRVKELWSRERDNIQKSADSINAAIISSTIQLPGGEMNASQLDAAFSAFSQNYDSQHGGFGRRTKFPKPQNILFLLRYWHRTGKKEPLAMVEKTLTAMRLGGIYDHLGYGFHRYATDAEWRVPHFEKMLYDQALLVIAYLEAYQATSNEEYANTAKEILSYVLRDMTAKNGGFYSAESADSEGEEGKFYIWSAEEIRKILNKQDAAVAAKIFHIMEGGNYIDSVTGKKTGQNILYIEHTADKLSEYDRISSKLLTARNSRPRPERDDKILTDWNGLMIAAFAKAAQVLDKPEYGEAAKRATQFILNNLRTQDGKLLHRWREGRAGLTASAADYSFMTWGLLELYSWDFDPKWLKYALDLTSNLIENYWDDKLGGFYLTVYDKKSMLPRIKESIDTAMPSSNSVSMFNLLKLSRLTGNHTFEEKAAKISSLSSSRVKDSPLAFPMLLAAHDLAQAPSQEVVIVGKRDADDTKEMLKTLRKNYFPNAVVLFKPAGEANSQIMKFANYIEFMNAIDSKATAFVCTNFKCDFPTTDPATMLNSLRSISEKSRETN
ncbi:MAG: thioredoxin domain-containing protein [Deltaproteobacteria bacterium]|nr:MAG: thioredoxin domain-containing protein [Deltaproteobacteria bacterium]